MKNAAWDDQKWSDGVEVCSTSRVMSVYTEIRKTI